MSSGVVEIWRLRAVVKPGRLEAFRTWADAQGAGWFDFLAGGVERAWRRGFMGLCLGLWSLSQDRRPAIDSSQSAWEFRPTRLHIHFPHRF